MTGRVIGDVHACIALAAEDGAEYVCLGQRKTKTASTNW
jgi:hypothetical protein